MLIGRGGPVMSTVPLPGRSPSRLRPKYLLFAFIGLMIAYVLYHSESFLIDSADPVWKHYAIIKGTLLPHGIAGAIALFLGFWEQLGDAAVETIVWTRVALAYPLADLTLLIEERLRARAADRVRGTPPRAGDPGQHAAASAQADD